MSLRLTVSNVPDFPAVYNSKKTGSFRFWLSAKTRVWRAILG